MIDLVFNNKTKYSKFSQEYFKNILIVAEKIVGLKSKNFEVSLNMISEKAITELNKKYRHKDKPTDVLSFPLEDDKLSKYGIMPLGDIFVCPSFVEKDSLVRNIEFNEEIMRVVIHGFLHLLGYDHEISDQEESKMINLQEKILDEIKINESTNNHRN